MTRLSFVGGGDDLQMWGVAVSVLSKWWRTTDKWLVLQLGGSARG